MSNNKSMSWGWIVFWFILFWPVGLYFLFKKVGADKTAILKNSKTVAIISYVLIAMGVVYLLSTITEDVSMIPAAFLFIGGGVWVNIVARKMKLNGEKYKKYIHLVINQSMIQIDDIAKATGVSYDTARDDLQKMIDLGYFTGAYINEGNREIVLPAPSRNTGFQTSAVQTKTRVATCKSCGANNSIFEGQSNECEYCGSPIE